MKIENREENQGIVEEHKGGGRSIRDDGNETTPGEVIYRLSVSHQPLMWQAWTLPWCTVKTVHLYIPRHSLYWWHQTNFHQAFVSKSYDVEADSLDKQQLWSLVFFFSQRMKWDNGKRLMFGKLLLLSLSLHFHWKSLDLFTSFKSLSGLVQILNLVWRQLIEIQSNASQSKLLEKKEQGSLEQCEASFDGWKGQLQSFKSKYCVAFEAARWQQSWDCTSIWSPHKGWSQTAPPTKQRLSALAQFAHI